MYLYLYLIIDREVVDNLKNVINIKIFNKLLVNWNGN